MIVKGPIIRAVKTSLILEILRSLNHPIHLNPIHLCPKPLNQPYIIKGFRVVAREVTASYRHDIGHGDLVSRLGVKQENVRV